MLLETTHREVTSSGVMQTAKATIKATPKIFNFFADQTYANKPLAICRELAANAIDAHTAAGNSDPIEVWLPSELDPVFRVRDRGIGMSHEFMMTRFMAYTDGSTKDQSNDQIGGFGIGSKSPFAYCDQFTIRSTHDGVVSVYTVFKDEDDVPAIGLLAQGEADEPNGVEVSFPVKEEDFNTFAEAAQAALQFFHPLPTVYGTELTPPTYTARGNGWAIREKSGPLGVIMGGVRYPVLTSNLSYELRWHERLKSLLEYGLDLTLPIGACGVALSREALSYDERTSASIQTALEAAVDDIVETFSTIFDRHDTLWEASKALGEEIGDGYNPRANLLDQNAVWRGNKLEKRIKIEAGRGQMWKIEARGDRRRQSSKVGAAKWEGLFGSWLTPARVAHVIVDDLPQVAKSRTIARIKAFVESTNQAKETLVLRPWESEGSEALLGVIGNPADYILASTLEAPAVQRSGPRWDDRPRVRMFTGSSEGCLTRGRLDLNDFRTDELPYSDQPVTGILVVMNNFEMPSQFVQRMKSQLIDWSEIHFVNQGDAAKLKGWQTFDDAFAERLAEAVAEYPELPERLAVAALNQLSDAFLMLRTYRNRLELSSTQMKSPFGRIVTLFDRYVAPLTLEQRLLSPFITAKLPPRIDAEALINAFNTKQWRASRLLDLFRHQLSDPKDRELFLENL